MSTATRPISNSNTTVTLNLDPFDRLDVGSQFVISSLRGCSCVYLSDLRENHDQPREKIFTDGQLVLGTTAKVFDARLGDETRSEEQNLPIKRDISGERETVKVELDVISRVS